jgi:hypothetical protein
MTLALSLTAEETDLLVQQDTEFSVALRNAGKRMISLGLPPLDPTQPVVRVLNLQTGTEDEFRVKKAPGGIRHGPATLAPGQSLSSSFSLLRRVPDLAPGNYEVRVAWSYDGGAEESVSNPVRIQVAPTTPRNPQFATAAAGNGTYEYAAWVNMASDPPFVVRSRFAICPGASVSGALPVAKCPTDCRPVISSPGTQTMVACQWVAWVEDMTLKFAHVDDAQGVSKVEDLNLPSAEIRIVPPLFCSPRTSQTIRPAGAALLCLGLPGATQFRLQTLELREDKANPLGAGNLPGRMPDWIKGFARLSDEWLATWIQVTGQDVKLTRGSWPGLKAQEVAPKELGKWQGQFLCADAALGRDFSIHGAILMWETPEGEEVRKLFVNPWKLSPKNEFSKLDPVEVTWKPADPITAHSLRVNDEGAPAALLRDVDGTWHVFDGKKVVDAPVLYQKTKQPIELAFLNGIQDPVLIVGTMALGFRIVDLGGNPIKPRPK